MTCVINVLSQLNVMDTDYTGQVYQVSPCHWIIGGDEEFPIHIEALEQPHRFIIYGTGLRQTGAPIYSSMMSTQFLENLNGYALGNYGICPGLVTMTVYQIITMRADYSIERLAAEIVCHRMLTECFLDAEFDPDDDWPRTVQELEDSSPITPFQH